MDKQQEKVKEFHRVYTQPVAVTPTLMSDGRRLVRGNLLMEEVNEFISATTMTAQAKELADVIYIALGTAVELGIDIGPIFDLVHKSNMDKVWPDGTIHKRKHDGKVLKPPTHEQPYGMIQETIWHQTKEGEEFVRQLTALFTERQVVSLDMPTIIRVLAKRLNCRQSDVKAQLYDVSLAHGRVFHFVEYGRHELTINRKVRLSHYLPMNGRFVGDVVFVMGHRARTKNDELDSMLANAYANATRAAATMAPGTAVFAKLSMDEYVCFSQTAVYREMDIAYFREGGLLKCAYIIHADKLPGLVFQLVHQWKKEWALVNADEATQHDCISAAKWENPHLVADK